MHVKFLFVCRTKMLSPHSSVVASEGDILHSLKNVLLLHGKFQEACLFLTSLIVEEESGTENR